MSVVGAFIGRVPPHSLEAERSVLGGILLHAGKLDEVADRLRPSDFYVEANGLVYRAMLDLSAKSQPVDMIQIANLLRDRGELEPIGGLGYLSGLLDGVQTSAGIVGHAGIVADKARVRAILGAALDILEKGYGSYGDAGEYADAAESAIYEAARDRTSRDVRSVSEIVRETFHWLAELRRSGVETFGVPTGIEELDEMLAGLQPSGYYIVGAATSVGKTTFAVQIAKGCGLPVFLASAEMSQRQVVLKLLSGEAGLPVYRILKPRYWGRDGGGRLTDAARRVDTIPMWIDDAGPMTVQRIWSTARRLKAKEGIGMVIVDYLQIVEPPDRSKGRERQVGEISAGLKAMAKDLDLPVLALSQLNRLGSTERPQLHHLRDSGSLEQDVDGAIFLYRPEKGKHKPDEPEPTEVILAKNRVTGPIGSVQCEFDPVTQMITQTQAGIATSVQDQMGGDIFGGEA